MLCRYNFQLESAVFWESLHNLECAINRTCTQRKESVTYFLTICFPQIQLHPKSDCSCQGCQVVSWAEKALAMCKVTFQAEGSGGGRRFPFCWVTAFSPFAGLFISSVWDTLPQQDQIYCSRTSVRHGPELWALLGPCWYQQGYHWKEPNLCNTLSNEDITSEQLHLHPVSVCHCLLVYFLIFYMPMFEGHFGGRRWLLFTFSDMWSQHVLSVP